MKAPTTKMSLERLRAEGWTAEVVEQTKRNPVTGLTWKADLFGIIDILAVRDDETLGVQTTTQEKLPAHCRKIAKAEATPVLLAAGWRIVCHGWHQPNGPRTRWQVEEVEVSTAGQAVDQMGESL